MKSRNREVNIFNMSLLDILCGALGAFCFLMLALFPYYTKAGGSVTAEQFEDLRRKLDEATRMAAKGDQEGLIRNLRQQIQQYQQAWQNEQSRRKKAEREVEAWREENKWKNPAMVQVWWSGSNHDIDLFLRRPIAQREARYPDLSKKQDPEVRGDFRSDDTFGQGSESWIMQDMVPGVPTEVYVKLMDLKDAPDGTSNVFLSWYSPAWSSSWRQKFPVNSKKRILKLGTLTLSDGKLTFVPSSS